MLGDVPDSNGRAVAPAVRAGPLQFAGTDIGTIILLSCVIQVWYQMHVDNGTAISNRTFCATVYAMAIGVHERASARPSVRCFWAGCGAIFS